MPRQAGEYDPDFLLHLSVGCTDMSQNVFFMSRALPQFDVTVISPYGGIVVVLAADNKSWSVFLLCGRGDIHFSFSSGLYANSWGGRSREDTKERKADAAALKNAYLYLCELNNDLPNSLKDLLFQKKEEMLRLLS